MSEREDEESEATEDEEENTETEPQPAGSDDGEADGRRTGERRDGNERSAHENVQPVDGSAYF